MLTEKKWSVMESQYQSNGFFRVYGMNGDVKMTGNMTTYITKVNKACDDLDFVSARVLIETNLLKLSEAKYYRLLNTSARVLIKHVLANRQTQQECTKLSRADMLTIHKINEYCSNFDISMLKRTLKNSFELVQRPDIMPLLNNDAKIILDNMGALLGAHQVH
ncbi:hypothetical protein ACQKG7_13190 [Lysinibacillus fusiformis]|nr:MULTISPECIES: hypothetical protein [Lysinibacillus]MCT6931021.1 hypothetical protein [Lysinibacillus fusiformis]